eukprot:6204113-Pleurochrysis_carterae.AAC.2
MTLRKELVLLNFRIFSRLWQICQPNSLMPAASKQVKMQETMSKYAHPCQYCRINIASKHDTGSD